MHILDVIFSVYSSQRQNTTQIQAYKYRIKEIKQKQKYAIYKKKEAAKNLMVLLLSSYLLYNNFTNKILL